MSLALFHNPACSKSREALALLQAKDLTPEVIDYLQTPPSLEQLRELQRRLRLPARELLRKGEEAYAQLGLEQPTFSEDDLLAAIAAHPILLQRPIVVNGERALIARPPSLLLEFL
ncbi:arsenate reductase (glutaredoxin) [Pelomonas sp. V22]|uniref:arsenate reductase (glutaredoxin) n=1 Tax=Pelomonas sp. V22 TaxID=2822139 RepID=UPI0024A9EBA2|nr:arsenate reductase (glutaredoxin) [Pelomonas sp. V22]MDI4634154.1 arsenate reductase (glutaredoxin) [Pelomonas sp. V22]